MSLLGNLLGQSIGFAAGVFAYFFPFNKFIDNLKLKIEIYEKKLSKSLDDKHLNNKNMKSHDFLKFHKNIHKVEEEIDFYLSSLLQLKWFVIISLGILIIDGLFEFLSQFFPFYTLGMQRTVSWLFFMSLILVVVYFIQALKLNRRLKNE